MNRLLIATMLLLCACFGKIKQGTAKSGLVRFTENEILEQLDLSFKDIPDKYYPAGKHGDIKYNFFLDLEHGYFNTAGNRIHLFADDKRWAVVFEKSGYQNRATAASIELDYIGNCINYSVEKFEETTYISNTANITLIDSDEFTRIEDKESKESFEIIARDIKEIKVRDKIVPFNNNYLDYEKLGIKVKEYDNPNKLIGFPDFIRYLHETDPELISATDSDIRQHIPKDIPKLTTIDKFHYSSHYDDKVLPSGQELYKLIAKIIVTRDTANWKPTQKPNNSWKNWESGNL